MTGAEWIIVKGKKAVLGKVRHDGMDCLDWLKQMSGSKLFRMKLNDVWKAYWAWRQNNWKKFDEKYDPKVDGSPFVSAASDETDSNYQVGGFPFDIPQGMKKNFKKLYVFAHTKIPQDDDFQCGYGDYEVFINLDDKTTLVNGKPVSKVKDDGYEYDKDGLPIPTKKDKKRAYEFMKENVQMWIKSIGFSDDKIQKLMKAWDDILNL